MHTPEIEDSGVIFELPAYVLRSAWNSRCWTYQEAVLGRRLYFDTANGFRYLDSIYRTLDTGWTDWRTRDSWLLQLRFNVFPLFNSLASPADWVMLALKATCAKQALTYLKQSCSALANAKRPIMTELCHLALGSGWLAGSMLLSFSLLPLHVIALVEIWLLLVFLLIPIYLPFKRFSKCEMLLSKEILLRHTTRQIADDMTDELLRNTKVTATGQQTAENSQRADIRLAQFVQAWNALFWRTTTKTDDMHCILANLTELVAFKVMKIPTRSQRMRAIIASYEKLPLMLLFNPLPISDQLRDPQNLWLVSVPAGGPLESRPNILPMTLKDSKLVISIHDLANNMLMHVTTLVDSAPEHATVLDPVNKLLYMMVCDDEASHDSQVEYCYLVERVSLSSARSSSVVGGARLVVRERMDGEISCTYDCPVRASVDAWNAVEPIAPYFSQSAVNTFIKVPFCKCLTS